MTHRMNRIHELAKETQSSRCSPTSASTVFCRRSPHLSLVLADLVDRVNAREKACPRSHTKRRVSPRRSSRVG